MQHRVVLLLLPSTLYQSQGGSIPQSQPSLMPKQTAQGSLPCRGLSITAALRSGVEFEAVCEMLFGRLIGDRKARASGRAGAVLHHEDCREVKVVVVCGVVRTMV